MPEDIFQGALSRAFSRSQSPLKTAAISPVKAEPTESPVQAEPLASPVGAAAAAAPEEETAWAPLPGAADGPMHQSIYGAWEDDEEEVGI